MRNKWILFVCTGNTCRSPMAEVVLKSMFKTAGIKGITVKSAGLGAVDGEPMSKNSKQALRSAGYKVNAFKSKSVTRELVQKTDMVLCMTARHKEYLKGFSNVYTLAEATNTKDVIDPYGQDLETYKRTLGQIEIACREIVKEISKVKGE